MNYAPAHTDRPHRRFNPLSGSWVLVSPQRSDRPWQGATEDVGDGDRPDYDPTCYLCPGNARALGATNPRYSGPFVFSNDFPALLADNSKTTAQNQGPLFRRQNVRGENRVLCYSPRHDLGFARLQLDGIRSVVDLWCDQHAELSEKYANVLIFENRGAAMGCSNPHPHGQIWASNFVPTEIRREDDLQLAYFRKHGSPLLEDYARQELQDQSRVVTKSVHWVCVVPYWASWPFETIVLPLDRPARFSDLEPAQTDDLASILKRVTTIYDNLFTTEFPYSMGWHCAPEAAGDAGHWILHGHFYPPLLRSAKIRKHMVGFELLGEPQRDLTPEKSAEIMRSVATTHYRDAEKMPA